MVIDEVFASDTDSVAGSGAYKALREKNFVNTSERSLKGTRARDDSKAKRNILGTVIIHYPL